MLANREDHIRQMIEQVIFTIPGERVMLPDFGVGLERLLFESTARRHGLSTVELDEDPPSTFARPPVARVTGRRKQLPLF